MSSLPDQVQKRLADEFKLAASMVAKSSDISEKNYYFSVFFGETGRQLNMHWDADLSLLHLVVQAACQQIGGRAQLTSGASFPLGGFPDGFLPAIDEVSNELATAFEGKEVDVPRLYAAISRIAELTYLISGNGVYLYQKGMIGI